MLMNNGNKMQENKDLEASADGDAEDEAMMDMTLDLGDYLPDEVDQKEVQQKDKAASQGSNRKRGVSEISTSAPSTSTTISDSSTSSATATSRLAHKREGSPTLLGVAGPSKRREFSNLIIQSMCKLLIIILHNLQLEDRGRRTMIFSHGGYPTRIGETVLHLYRRYPLSQHPRL